VSMLLAGWMLGVLKVLDPRCRQQFLGHSYESTVQAHQGKSFQAQFLRQCLLRPRAPLTPRRDSAERRTSLFIGRRRGSAKRNRPSASFLRRSQHEQPVDASPAALGLGYCRLLQLVGSLAPWSFVNEMYCFMHYR